MKDILIIDDDELLREFLKDLLTKAGYNIIVAENGKKGLTLLHHQPQIIILGLNMPVMSGIDFLKQLNPGKSLNCSIIVLAGFASDEAVKTCYDLGIHSFLRKPINSYEILGLVKRNLELIEHRELLKFEINEKKKAFDFLKHTFEGMSEGVVMLDDNFCIQMLSKKACRILTVDVEKALNKPAVSFLGSMIAGPKGVLSNIIKTKKEILNFKTQVLSVSGAIIPIYLTVKPLDRFVSPVSYLLFLKDRREEERIMCDQASSIKYGRMISSDPKMKEIFQMVDNIATSNATIVITGETGTGKELLTREIHDRSLRAQKPFHAVNCAAIPVNLMESEFFGHEKGAFTGAIKTKQGRFELANRGTLFLDEIAEIPLDIQVKLLRVLQEKTFERVGGTKTIKVDVRIIAATNQELTKMVEEKKFREDFFYRLDVIRLNLPPLRKRLQDIPLLVSFFVESFNASENRKIIRVSPDAIHAILAYQWPGNVRELYHVIERAFAVCKSDTIQEEHLPEKIRKTLSSNNLATSEVNSERESIMLALEKASFKKKKAASLLGISPATLYRKLKKYQL